MPTEKRPITLEALYEQVGKLTQRVHDLEHLNTDLAERVAELESPSPEIPDVQPTEVTFQVQAGPFGVVGDDGPFKLKQKKMTGYKNIPTGIPAHPFRKIKEYGEWVELGGFSALHKAIAHISTIQRGTDLYGVFMGKNKVYSI